MSENQIDINSLHHLVQRESESDTLMELNPNFYQNLSDYFGNLKKQEFDGVENKIKDKLIELSTELTAILINIRLAKISSTNSQDHSNMLDEEKFIFDSQEEKLERIEMIISSTINGKSKFLENLTENHKTKKIVIRFLSDVDELVGSDLERYGPFKSEDIATIPYENAQALISKNVATKIRIED
jgi:DNA replication factor GINS